MIESQVDVRADIDAINRGEGVRRGDTYEINGRTYRLAPDGHTYPVSGAGFHQLTCRGFRALGVYNTFGPTARAEEILDRMGIPAQDRLAGLNAWRVERNQ